MDINLKSLVFELIFDKEQAGVTAISVVDSPAILTNFMKFSETIRELKLAVDSDRKVITGPVIIPNVKIFRSGKSLGLDQDAYVYFKENTIRQLMEHFIGQAKNNDVTLGHETDTDKLTLRESWIIEDKEHDKAAFLGFDLPVGTWMASYKVNDDELWAQIKKGEFNGYSIEAALGMIPMGEISLSKQEECDCEDHREVLPESEWPFALEHLKKVGQKEEDFLKEWELLEFSEEDEEILITLAIESDPEADSFLDKEGFAVRYKYVGPRDDKNRQFCADMLDANLIYRKEDINQMSFRGENPMTYTRKDGTTSTPQPNYSIFDWKGSYNCRHSFKRLVFKKKKDQLKKTTSKLPYEINDEKATSKNPKVVK